MPEPLMPSLGDIVSEIVGGTKHSQEKKNRTLGAVLYILFYLAATFGLVYAGYIGYQKATAFWTEHRELEKKLIEIQASEKELLDVEHTLSLAYDQLTEWEARYYARIFMDFSKQYGIPWEAYAALIRYESNFNPTLKSDSNALGISQVLEPTARRMALKLGIRYRKDETLWYDLLNLIIGLTYFSEGYQDAIQEGQTRSEALQHAMRRYVSGTGSITKIKKMRPEAQLYVQEYRTSLWQEFKKLTLFYRGVKSGDSDSTLMELE